MPALGMSQEKGTLVRWLKAEGEAVEKGEPLMEVETDKAVVEVEAPASGLLAQVTARVGDEVPVGQRIALITAPGTVAPGTAAPGRPAASPRARRLAQERGLDLGSVQGSGPGGAVVEQDLLGVAPAPEPIASSLWRAMAENVARAWREVPHFFLVREVDASQLVLERRRHGADVTYSDLLVWLAAAALRRHPPMNSGREEVNVGLAVAVPDGLIVPVLRGADRLSVAEIGSRRAELVQRAQAGRMKAGDLDGATFTISNLGMYGVDLFLAIVSEGQAGILAVGRIADRVVAVEGRPAVRPMLTLALSCDHRVVDGARGAEFLQALAELVEDPSSAQ
ncbi:MAG TPA: dihydrolipoamide acetyltransferase family protein [Candidatus Acidoferrales bacterium]|nr:dihydrolipoamide acetyltransferase family protein [Candidatus Acidoferrales bacterium]